MANKLRRSTKNEKRTNPITYKQLPLSNETYIKIEYDRNVASEAWVLLPDNTVEHLICYPSGRPAKLAKSIGPPSSAVTTPTSEKSSYLNQTRHKAYFETDEVKAAFIRIDKEPPKRTLPSLMPLAEYISEDLKTWVGTYTFPSGAFVRRTSTQLDANDPPCYTANEMRMVDCPVDEKGRAMVRFFYVQTKDKKVGFWEKVAKKVFCA